MHGGFVVLFTWILAPLMLTDTGKTFNELPAGKILLFAIAVTALVFKGKDLRGI